ncbi:MAG TPA: hypothetical protein VFE24_08365, partial [Pirellulales bacterium]|nr:hypothetical protein [Pirellulales bacterium]
MRWSLQTTRGAVNPFRDDPPATYRDQAGEVPTPQISSHSSRVTAAAYNGPAASKSYSNADAPSSVPPAYSSSTHAKATSTSGTKAPLPTPNNNLKWRAKQPSSAAAPQLPSMPEVTPAQYSAPGDAGPVVQQPGDVAAPGAALESVSPSDVYLQPVSKSGTPTSRRTARSIVKNEPTPARSEPHSIMKIGSSAGRSVTLTRESNEGMRIE